MKSGIRKVVIGSLFAAAMGTAAQAEVSVGVTWYGTSGMTNAVLGGVQERLAEIGADITLDIRGELADAAELSATVDAFQAEGKNGMIVFRSSGSAYLAENPPSIPTFIGGGNHPEMLGAVDSLDTPGGQVTGVTYFIPLEGPLESFMELAPQVESFLLVSQTGYPSSAIDGKGTLDACEALAIACKQVFATGEAEVAQVVADNIGSYDAVILGNQAAVFEHAGAALDAAAGKPVFSYAAKGVELGALGGVIADDHKLGRMLADSLVAVLVDGQPIRQVGVKTDPDPMLVLNMRTVDALDLEPPLALLGSAELIE